MRQQDCCVVCWHDSFYAAYKKRLPQLFLKQTDYLAHALP